MSKVKERIIELEKFIAEKEPEFLEMDKFMKNQREYVGLKEQFPTASRAHDESLTSFL